ncbi:MAG TPA: DUF167 domain-containing protein [Candidatus Paceibacterota bacterium]
MKISVQARPGAREELVEELGYGKYRVWVKEPPEKGLANKAIVYALSQYFRVTQASVRMISGHTSRNKVMIVDR